MTHEELLLTPEYWTAKIQIDLFQKVEQYLEENGLNRSDLAKKLGVSKGYITQVLNGEFDHRISKLVSLALAIGYIPKLTFEEIGADCAIAENVTDIANVIKETGSMELKYPVGNKMVKSGKDVPVKKDFIKQGKIKKCD